MSTQEQKKERIENFEKKILELQEEFGLQLYAVNAVMQDGEVSPLIKVRFTKEDVAIDAVVDGEVIEKEEEKK